MYNHYDIGADVAPEQVRTNMNVDASLKDRYSIRIPFAELALLKNVCM